MDHTRWDACISARLNVRGLAVDLEADRALQSERLLDPLVRKTFAERTPGPHPRDAA